MINLLLIALFILLPLIIPLVKCLENDTPQPQRQLPQGTLVDNSTDILEEGKNILSNIIATLPFPQRPINESAILPNADLVHRYDNTSEVYKLAVFYANMCRTSNCRASFDKWDCENCHSTLPDGVVIRAFQTYPLGVTGEVVLSEKYVLDTKCCAYLNLI